VKREAGENPALARSRERGRKLEYATLDTFSP